MTIWRHVQAIAILPFMVTFVIPTVILYCTGVGGMALGRPVPWGVPVLAGALLFLTLGLTLLVLTIRMFIQIGRGTLAPWSPTERLVVSGIYRHVRNPMITGVMCVLLGEAMLFGSPQLLTWLAIFVAVNLIYTPFLEEPGLEKRFGEDYIRYKENVPRWLPRLTPWEGSSENRTIGQN